MEIGEAERGKGGGEWRLLPILEIEIWESAVFGAVDRGGVR